MRTTFSTLACYVSIIILIWGGVLYAQKGGTAPGPQPSPSTSNSSFYSCGSSTICGGALMRQWQGLHEVPFHLEQHVRKSKEWDKETALKESRKLIEALSLPCELSDAERSGGGKVKVSDKMLDVSVYEVACSSGSGYFLVSQPPENSLAVSCFAADAVRAQDIANGVKPDEFYCTLPGNKDVKTMAASMLQGAGTTCDVSNYRWVGTSTIDGKEYSEVGCSDGAGYILEVPKTGRTAQVSVVGCQDAVKEGVKCTLTAVTMPVTLQTFRDAISEHAVDCTPAQIRYVGRETKGRRYVVELQCPQQPNGLVAFVPLEGNPKPFEALDCPAAVARAVKCTLSAKQ
jgi:hypothetical protein